MAIHAALFGCDNRAHFRLGPQPFTATLGFTAFMGGLLAKSVVELIKRLFKNVFNA
jgi:hypothetical protein